MTLDEFRELTEHLDGSQELIGVYQPSWPLQSSIRDVVIKGDGEEQGIYLALEEGNGYADSEVVEELGWR